MHRRAVVAMVAGAQFGTVLSPCKQVVEHAEPSGRKAPIRIIWGVASDQGFLIPGHDVMAESMNQSQHLLPNRRHAFGEIDPARQERSQKFDEGKRPDNDAEAAFCRGARE